MARPHNQTPVWLSHAKTAIRGCQLWRGSTPSDALPHELVSQFSSNERRNDPGSLRFGSPRSRIGLIRANSSKTGPARGNADVNARKHSDQARMCRSAAPISRPTPQRAEMPMATRQNTQPRARMSAHDEKTPALPDKYCRTCYSGSLRRST